ncbi:coiled-coil domain-containing protein 166-like [Mytilus trossulus]|uniref:coiled-coil domain-containing protein 166-like n=1 Tax=Mytilus trossulus TaxID=6551 RepID=UPI003006C5B8
MPPKKGKKGKGKKGKKGGKGDKDDGAGEGLEKPRTPEPSEKEVILQQELEKVTNELETNRARVQELRKEHEWLQQEANRVKMESHEYMSYMDTKETMRKTAIITLSDHYKHEIQDIQDEKSLMELEFNEKKEALQKLLMEKENTLKKTTEELSQLQEYKDLQDEQLSKIKSLEAEVMQMRAKHSDTIQQVKSTFLKDKKEYEEDSREKINTLERLANKEAIQCLTDHTNRIKTENRQLRKELLDLINITRAYKAHQLDLQEQKKQLVREQQYAGDLKTLRTTRQHKVLKKFGMLTDNADSSDNEGTTS